ncbi:MAG: DegT/DnrJ/EryC1/StrS family aminotransferase [Nanoarchaeota archaeon]
MSFKYPLNESHFTFLDRLKICKFFLNPKERWTQGKYVEQYEKAWADYTGAKYVVMTSSGSTANTLIAQYVKDNTNPNKNIVVFPAITWSTSVNPWIREGFHPHFIDVSLGDLSIDINKLEVYLKRKHLEIACVFVTSLLGFTPDINSLKEICDKYNVDLKLDNCENSFGTFRSKPTPNTFQFKHVCELVTSSISNYFGHQTTNGSESGLIFTNNHDEYIYYLLARNHGMLRGLDFDQSEETKAYKLALRNPNVDERFDFVLIGNNYRNTNIGAYMGLLDFKRKDDYIKRRKSLYDIFYRNLNRDTYILPDEFPDRVHVPFSLPIIINPNYKNDTIALKEEIQTYCENNSIEYRPIISGNLLRHTCYKKYGRANRFPNAEYIHNNGIYIGLYPKLSEDKLLKITKDLDFKEQFNSTIRKNGKILLCSRNISKFIY